jgi:hypothetical protein
MMLLRTMDISSDQVRSLRDVCLSVGSPLDSRRIRCSAEVVGLVNQVYRGYSRRHDTV